MAKRRKGLQLPAAYEALKKAKAAGADADTLGAPPTPAEAAAEPGGAQLAAGLTGRRGSSGEAEPAQRDALGAGHVGGPGSPEAGGADGPDEQPPEGDGLRDGSDEPPAKAKAGKGAPVLPWMRLPVSIEPGTGVPLAGVRGLDARLLASLRASAPRPGTALQLLHTCKRHVHSCMLVTPCAEVFSAACAASCSVLECAGTSSERLVLECAGTSSEQPSARVRRYCDANEGVRVRLLLPSAWRTHSAGARRRVHGAVPGAGRGLAAHGRRAQRRARPVHLRAHGLRQDARLRAAHRGGPGRVRARCVKARARCVPGHVM
jgi:hypothetical protein